MFFFIYTRTNAWKNTPDAGDLRRHRAHYDVTVMTSALVQVKACRLLSVKPFLNNCWLIVNSILGRKLQGCLKIKIPWFSFKDAFTNVVCKMSTILLWPQCVNFSMHAIAEYILAASYKMHSYAICDLSCSQHRACLCLVYHCPPIDWLSHSTHITHHWVHRSEARGI